MIFAPILREPVRISPVGRFPSNTSTSSKTTTDYSECLSTRTAAGRFRSFLKPAKLQSVSAAAERFRPPTASVNKQSALINKPARTGNRRRLASERTTRRPDCQRAARAIRRANGYYVACRLGGGRLQPPLLPR